MHCGKNNPRNKYYIDEEDGNKLELKTTEVKKNLENNDYDEWQMFGTG